MQAQMRVPSTLAALLVFACLARADETPQVKEVMVVTASRTEQRIHDAPVAVSVITDEDLAGMPAQNFADVLRTVPGVNVTQMNAREMQVTSRSATNSLATSQLVLLDGRSLYLDFFGFVMWDFLPVHMSEIKQIEVVRGPGSAVWGANAVTGVINFITKRPREMEGSAFVLGGGERGTMYGNLTHAAARDRWSYKLSGGWYQQDAFARPSGLIPGTQTPYPAFRNEGTRQPKAEARGDYDLSEKSYISFAGGYAGTDGLVHTGIGPFDLARGSSLTFAKADWTRGALRATAFANVLDANSTNLMQYGVDNRPLAFAFETRTYSADVIDTRAIRERHIVTYGATARYNEFDLSIAPEGDERKEYGAFVQDEVLFGKARLVAGARVDHIDPIGSVFSPRAAMLFSPTPNQTVRASFSRAFRAPSLINNYLDTAILTPVTLPTGPFVFATLAVGNPNLSQEQTDAWELGYVANFPGRVVVSASLYRNVTRDFIDFYAASFYTASNPPARWPLPPAFLNAPPLRNALPSAFSYRNVGRITNQGAELELRARPSADWSWYANYSFQADPVVKGIPEGEINVAPANRVNTGVSWVGGRYFLNGAVTYQDEAIWRDVLDARYWGPTEAFLALNASGGIRVNERITITVTGTNLTDRNIQQHVFGDVIGRQLTAQVRFEVGK